MTRFPAAGLLAGPLAWAITTQGGYSFAPLLCATRASVYLFVASLWLAGISLIAAFISFEAFRAAGPQRDGQPRRLLAYLGVGTGVLFAFVIGLQGAAAFMLTGCER
jgi:hypothetical protein